MNRELEKRAIGFAAAQTLCFSDESVPFYDNYMLAIDAVAQGEEPDNCAIFSPFEHMEWNAVISHIESESDAILDQFKQVLDLAKAGIIQCAIDGSLDSDMNTLCMQSMTELGAKDVR